MSEQEAPLPTSNLLLKLFIDEALIISGKFVESLGDLKQERVSIKLAWSI